MRNYDQVRKLLDELSATDVGSAAASSDRGGLDAWRLLWSAVAARLVRDLESNDPIAFETAFQIVSDAVNACEPLGRQAAVAALFGDLTRRAIASGFDRTRFVGWFGPGDIFEAPDGRKRGRVLYFDSGKGREKILGADRTVYFVHFSAIRSAGFRSLEGGQFVEFSPLFGNVNGRETWMANNVARLAESDGSETTAGD